MKPFLKNARRARRRAVALPLVLVSLAFLAFVVAEIVATATQRLAWENQGGHHNELRQEAFSALEATMATLAAFQTNDGGLFGPAQGWSNPLAEAGYVAPDGMKVAVTLRDETGYYSLPAIANDPTTTGRRFFEDLGLGESQAQTLADCLADWTDSNTSARTNGAEKDSYPTDEIAPPNRPIQSLDEFKHILNFPEVFFDDEDAAGNELWKMFSESVTLVATGTLPNINTAPRAVLDLLAQRYNVDPESILAIRERDSGVAGNGTVLRNASDLGRHGIPAAIGSAVSFTCVKLRVIIRVSRGDTSLVLDTLLNTGSGIAVEQQRINSYVQE